MILSKMIPWYSRFQEPISTTLTLRLTLWAMIKKSRLRSIIYSWSTNVKNKPTERLWVCQPLTQPRHLTEKLHKVASLQVRKCQQLPRASPRILVSQTWARYGQSPSRATRLLRTRTPNSPLWSSKDNSFRPNPTDTRVQKWKKENWCSTNSVS